MNSAFDQPSADLPASQGGAADHGQMLVLVQDHLVVGSFSKDQFIAALDLARVLCRALAQPFDLFQLRDVAPADVQVGMQAMTEGPLWLCLARVRPSLHAGSEVEIYQPPQWHPAER